MKKGYFLLLVFTITSAAITAQTIDFTLADPQPDLIEVYGGSFASGDIDGDGDQDLLIAGQDPGRKTELYLNDGSGNFTVVENTPLPVASSSVTIFIDLDLDNDLDLFFSGRGFGIGDFTHTYLNNGSGEFTQLANPALPQFQGRGVAFGDVDGDGDSDLLIAVKDANDDFVADVYINDGNANFSPSGNTILAAVEFGSVAFIDVENDGDADVIISGALENDSPSTILYVNDGSGNYSVDTNTDFEQVAGEDIDIADTDNDGDLDILISGRSPISGPRTILYINDGDGAFTELVDSGLQQTFAGTNAIADLDNDGDQDLVIIGSQEGGIPNIFNIVYENLGNNEFSQAIILGGEYIAACVINDFSGDGLADIIIQGFVDDTNVYWNNTKVLDTPDQLAIDQRLTIYPNPSKGNFNIHSNTDQTSAVKIFTVNGKLVYQNELIRGLDQMQLNLPNGLYMAVITSNNLIQTHKLMISK